MQSTQASGPRPRAEWKGGPEAQKTPRTEKGRTADGSDRREQKASRGPETSLKFLASRERSRPSLLFSFHSEENKDRAKDHTHPKERALR